MPSCRVQCRVAEFYAELQCLCRVQAEYKIRAREYREIEGDRQNPGLSGCK